MQSVFKLLHSAPESKITFGGTADCNVRSPQSEMFVLNFETISIDSCLNQSFRVIDSDNFQKFILKWRRTAQAMRILDWRESQNGFWQCLCGIVVHSVLLVYYFDCLSAQKPTKETLTHTHMHERTETKRVCGRRELEKGLLLSLPASHCQRFLFFEINLTSV